MEYRSKGRYKRGSADTLVLEERILLVLTTYAPNLWKVFLTYCTDAVRTPLFPSLLSALLPHTMLLCLFGTAGG